MERGMYQRPLLTLACLVSALACADAPMPSVYDDPAWQTVEKSSGSDDTYGDGVRLALADVADDLPQADYRDLLSEGLIRESTLGQSVRLSGQLRRGLLASVNGRVDRLGEGVVRVYNYDINGRVPRMKLNFAGLSGRLPFNLRGGSQVQIAQVFPGVAEARRARPLSLLNIPHDRDSALALPPNTIISVPVEARISLSVGGSFLQKAASFTRTLLKFVRTSAFGSFSGIRQGTLVGEGTYRLQFIRLDGDRIRVRAVSGTDHNARGTVTFGGNANAHYTFTPASTLERARSIRRQLERAGRHLETARRLPDRLALLRGDLPGSMDRLFEAYPELAASDVEGLDLGDAEPAEDQAIDLAAAVNARLDQFDEAVLSKVEAQLERVEDLWDTRVRPTLNRINRLSSHALNIGASVSLNGTFARELRTVADFEYDLSDPEAVIAFERAVSGRTIWRGAMGLLAKHGLDKGGLADFTLSDTLATEQSARPERSVIRHSTAAGDAREKNLRLTFSGLWLYAGFGWRDRNNKVELVDGDGRQTTWLARAWEHSRQVRNWQDADSESVGSGAFSLHDTDDVLDGGYWFAWRRTFPSAAASPVHESVTTALNTLGPLGLEKGVQSLYHGEYEGKVNTELAVLFNGEALTALFDPASTPDSLLWSVLAETVSTFHNPGILPYMIAPIRPAGLDQVEGAAEACETVAVHLGGVYCRYFVFTFLPTLRGAQASDDPEERLAFFETFYKAGPFGSGAGSRFFVRYVAALVHALGEGDGVSVRFTVRNGSNPSEAASPRLEVGAPVDLTLLESTAPMGMR